MFSWFRRKNRGEVALTFVQGETKREVSVRELALGNKLAGDALLAVLVEKGLVDAEEIQAKIHQLGRQNWRPAERDAAGDQDHRERSRTGEGEQA